MALTDNLVAYWEFESNGNDSHSVGPYNLTANGTPSFGAGGRPGNAVTLDGSVDYLTRASHANLSAGNVDFTLAGWVYLDSVASYAMILSKWGFADADKEYNVRYNSTGSQFEFLVRAPGGGITQVEGTNFGAASPATWYFFAAWHDTSVPEAGLSINAGSANTFSHSGGVTAGSAQFEVGNGIEITGTPMNGRLDSLGIWRRVLTGAERTALYNGGNGVSYAGLSGGAPTPINLYYRRRR